MRPLDRGEPVRLAVWNFVRRAEGDLPPPAGAELASRFDLPTVLILVPHLLRLGIGESIEHFLRCRVDQSFQPQLVAHFRPPFLFSRYDSSRSSRLSH